MNVLFNYLTIISGIEYLRVISKLGWEGVALNSAMRIIQEIFFNKRGPSIDPWEIPLAIDCQEENVTPSFTGS